MPKFIKGSSSAFVDSPRDMAMLRARGFVEATEPDEPTKADLQAQAADLGLPTSGTKAELTARIAEASPEA